MNLPNRNFRTNLANHISTMVVVAVFFNSAFCRWWCCGAALLLLSGATTSVDASFLVVVPTTKPFPSSSRSSWSSRPFPQQGHNANTWRGAPTLSSVAARNIAQGPARRFGDDVGGDGAAAAQRQQPHLLFPGGGIMFYWMAGVVTYLREQGYDLSQVQLSGASAGALAATLTATNVDFYRATDLALQLAADAGVWDRSGGLAGIWGPLIHEWLDELLPDDDDVVKACVNREQRLTLLVTPVPQLFAKEKVNYFHGKEDLIRCNMASVHLPYFLDSKLTSSFRGRPFIDGSFLAKLEDYHGGIVRPPGSKFAAEAMQQQEQSSSPSSLSSSVLILDFKDDPTYRNQGVLDFVAAVKPSGIYQFIEEGKRYAKEREEQGMFSVLTKSQR